MMIFTHEEMNPREKTLEMIRQIAHTYRTMRMSNGMSAAVCLN